MTQELKINSSIEPTAKWVFSRFERMLAFGLGTGLSPIAPGTVGTLWAWAVFLLGSYFLSIESWLWLIACGSLLGCWVCGKVSEELGKKDYGGIVWDEILAFWLILAIVMPANLVTQTFAFALFRFFDAVKPGPIGVIDRHFKNLENQSSTTPSSPKEILWRGFGIIVDDFAAAFFTLLIILLSQTLLKYFS